MTPARSRIVMAFRLAATIILALAPVVAAAQEPVTSFDLLSARLTVGQTIWVTDASGREFKGKLRALSSTFIVLDADGARQDFPAARVGRIDKPQRDSLRNGVLWGALVGFVGGAASCALNPECVGDESGAHVTVVLGLLGAGAGAGIGAVIDARIKGARLVVYRGAGAHVSARLSLAPIVTRRTKGVRLSFSF
jgi:hypothetical protein